MTATPEDPRRTGRRTTLAALVARCAPLPPRRAAAIMLAVTEEAVHRHRIAAPVGTLDPRRVELHPDGGVQLLGVEPCVAAGDPLLDTASSIGPLLLELTTGRSPLDRDDALHLATSARLPPDLVALVVRCRGSTAPPPSLAEWHAALVRTAGSQAPDPAPRLRRARRRRAAAVAAGLLLLAVLSTTVVLLAPRWSGSPPGLVVAALDREAELLGQPGDGPAGNASLDGDVGIDRLADHDSDRHRADELRADRHGAIGATQADRDDRHPVATGHPGRPLEQVDDGVTLAAASLGEHDDRIALGQRALAVAQRPAVGP